MIFYVHRSMKLFKLLKYTFRYVQYCKTTCSDAFGGLIEDLICPHGQSYNWHTVCKTYDPYNSCNDVQEVYSITLVLFCISALCAVSTCIVFIW